MDFYIDTTAYAKQLRNDFSLIKKNQKQTFSRNNEIYEINKSFERNIYQHVVDVRK